MILHTPVMLQEVLSFVPDGAKLIVDGTLGHGGHTLSFLHNFPQAQVIGLDIDFLMLQKAEGRMNNEEGIMKEHFVGLQRSYADIEIILKGKKADFILLDLGVNLEHFLATERGFSLKGNAPLDMRFDQGKTRTAADMVNTYSQSDLKNLFVRYGDFTEKKADELAEIIVRERKKNTLPTGRQGISTTFDLKKVLRLCGLGNPAIAVIFQAIRIEVNDELKQLKTFLQKFPSCLNVGGRCTIMSYHSIEDRLVKQCFQTLVNTGGFALLTKKVITPHYMEVRKNKAARSAKLRVIEKMGELRT